MSEARVEDLARALADEAKEREDSWCYGEIEGERFLGWDELPDEDFDGGGDWWVKGRDYYRMIARTAIRLLGLPELAAWIDFVQLRKLGDDWEARLVGEGQPQGWMRTLGVTARVAAEARGPSPADAIRFALEKEPR